MEEIRSVVHEAFRVATTGKRGPVHLDLPKDIMVALLHGDELPVSARATPTPIDQSNIADIARLMNGAERPILYVGQGAIDCAGTLRAFAAASNIPVTTTLHAMGIFDEHHPQSLHMLGMHGAARNPRTRRAGALATAEVCARAPVTRRGTVPVTVRDRDGSTGRV